MATNLQQILGGTTLTGVIQAIKAGIPNDLMPAEFQSLSRTVQGNQATYLRVDGNRETAKLVAFGSPSERRAQRGVTKVPVTLLHEFEHIFHEPATLMNLTNFNDPGLQKMGEQEISRQTADFKQLFLNSRLAAMYSSLSKGKIFFDADGNLDTSDTASTGGVTVDFGMDATHLNNELHTLTGITGDSGSTGKWSFADTDIVGQLSALKIFARKNTGYPLKFAFYGEDVIGKMILNTSVINLIKGDTATAAAFKRLEIPDGFMGFTWIPVGEAFYVNKDGTATTFWGTDTVTFTPAVTRDWWETFEGTYPVPTNIGALSSDAIAAMGNITTVAGMFAYAQVLSDPVAIKHLAGDTFLPVIKVPNALYILTVDTDD